MGDLDENEHRKEVYARFGLAVYFGQILEHGLVNALLVIDFIPTQRPRVRTRQEWTCAFDAFVGRHFERTMGQLLKRLAKVSTVPPELENLLREALGKRNYLAHEFFRKRSMDFMTSAGRGRMLAEVDACRELFNRADLALRAIVQPLRIRYGISDEAVEAERQALRAEGHATDK